MTREQLLDTVWTEHVAADELLTHAVSELRRVLEDFRRTALKIRPLLPVLPSTPVLGPAVSSPVNDTVQK